MRNEFATATLDLAPETPQSQAVVFLSDFLGLRAPRLRSVCLTRVRQGDDAIRLPQWTAANRLQSRYYAKKISAGQEALRTALEIAYGRNVSLSGEVLLDPIPPIRHTLNGQKIEPLVSRRDKSGDPNLLCDLRYARDRIQRVPRRPNQKVAFTDAYLKRLGVKPTVYGSEDNDYGDTARPARFYRAEAPFGAGVRWVRLTEKTIKHFPHNAVGDLVPVIVYPSAGLHAWRHDQLLETGTWRQQVQALIRREFPDAVFDKPSARSADRALADLAEFETQAFRIFKLQRQFDSLGHPLYFPRFIDKGAEWEKAKPYFKMPRERIWGAGEWVNLRRQTKPSVYRNKNKLVASPRIEEGWIIGAKLVDDISDSDLKELREMWDDILKEEGLGPCAVRQFPIHTWERSTQDQEEPEKVSERIHEYASQEAAEVAIGVNKAKKIKMLVDAIMGEMTSAEAAKRFSTTPEAFRKAKSRALKRPLLSIDERWYQASLRVKDKTDGLYALVKLPRKMPAMYFVMSLAPAEKIRNQVLVAEGDLHKAPYSLVQLQKARFDAVARVRGGQRGRRRQVILEAFRNAPLVIWRFQVPCSHTLSSIAPPRASAQSVTPRL